MTAGRVDAGPRPLRALVDNAGVSVAGPVEATPLEDWRRLFEVTSATG
jgi:NADP-dependent 3-hydroxy acid dehydrogenase YdfG